MSYFVETFDPHHKRAALRWARDDHDSFDQWGWAMGWLFDLCGELYNRGAYDVPWTLGYRPGPCGVQLDDYRAEGLAELSTEALEHAARVLGRFEAMLRARGESY